MKTIILVGAGPAHLYILREWKQEPIPGCRLVLLSPSPFSYNEGMLAGFAEGIYTEKDIRVPLIPYSRITGAEFVEDTIVKIDAEQNMLFSKKGKSYSYDLVSFNTETYGEIPASFRSLSSEGEANVDVVDSLVALRESDHPVVVGDDLRTIELAIAVQTWRDQNSHVAPVTLISHSTSSRTSKEQNMLQQTLGEKGIVWINDDVLTRLEGQFIKTEKDKSVSCTALWWSAHENRISLFEESQLQHTNGLLHVNETLQSLDDANIFATGDSMKLAETKSDLVNDDEYGTRQGFVLWYNMQSLMMGRPLKAYRSAKRTFTILSLGNQKALALFDNYSLKGRLAWRLHHKRNQDYMKRYK